MLLDGRTQPSGSVLTLVSSDGPSSVSGPAIWLPDTLSYLAPGDIVALSPDGSRIRVLWRVAAPTNSLLLTERCDNYCVMCSQPPKDRMDPWLVRRAQEVVQLLPPGDHRIGLTGGEPTLLGDDLLFLLTAIQARHPTASVHLLSNGRAFGEPGRAAAIAAIGMSDLMLGIPIYGAEAETHDAVVRADGAFDETLRGLVRLAEHGVKVEVRVVLQQQTAGELMAIAEFLSRNLPYVDQVAWMGLEMMGFARSNRDSVWIDPRTYAEDLADAATYLARSGLRSLIFNHPLCVLPHRIWPQAVRSISDWKNDFLPVCSDCSVQDRCGGLFSSGLAEAEGFVEPVGTSMIPTNRTHRATGTAVSVSLPSR